MKFPTALALALALVTNALAQDTRNTLLPSGYLHYAPSIVPDRIVLVPTATPERSQSVNWRTDTAVEQATAQIAKAEDQPGLHLRARTFGGETRVLATENGAAHHHSLTFDGLEEDTLYAYRVKGGDTWSEWFQFRTPQAGFHPYDILYFGDAQNAVKSHFSRVIREAHSTLPRGSLMIHAGDLVNSRDGVHDDEWGEWFDAGGWLHGMTNQLVAAGNHEYIEPEPDALRHLAPHWPVQFGTPDNGPEGLRDTTYFVNYQGVRYIVLDSMAAIQDEDNARLQAAWLEDVLKTNTARWTIVIHHHPVFSVSLGRDNPSLRQHWQPLYEKYGVHLILQGHDHTYGRGANVAEGTRARSAGQGPVYVVSVAGPKMYLVTEAAEQAMERTAEDTQLFQVIRFGKDRLSYESLTATGKLYDAFDLVMSKNKRIKLVDKRPNTPENRCTNPQPIREDRCWNGTELIMP